MISFRRQSTMPPETLPEILSELEHICARIEALSGEHEAIKAAMDRLYAEQQLIRSRLERIDGRLERAEIDAIVANPNRLMTQEQIPPDLRAPLLAALGAGLPGEGGRDG